MSHGSRDSCIIREKREWTRKIAQFVDTARAAGYQVTSLEDGAWRIGKDGEAVHPSSDSELYLYLVDRQVVTVNRLYPRPGVGE